MLAAVKLGRIGEGRAVAKAQEAPRVVKGLTAVAVAPPST